MYKTPCKTNNISVVKDRTNNMKRRIGLSVITVLILSACSTTEPQEQQSESISLTAKVEGANTNRVISIGANYTAPLDVAFARLDQNTSTGLYNNTYADVNTSLAATRDGGRTATEILFDEPQFYQSATANNDTRFVGWYPSVTPTAGVLTFDISDGATDVMLTQELVGNANHPMGTGDNSFFFRHQLCQVIVSVVATSPETVKRWGTVASVTVKRLPTSYIITLPGGTQAVGAADQVLNLRGGGGKKMDPATLSSTRFAECGYLLTAPSGNKLTLELTGGNGESRVVDAPLPAGQSFCSGYIYHLKLNLDGQEDALQTALSATGWEDEVNLDVEF